MFVSLLIITGFVNIGSVDYISNGYVAIEYVKNSEIHYIDISLSDARCQPEEGGAVIFDQDKIIKCFHKL